MIFHLRYPSSRRKDFPKFGSILSYKYRLSQVFQSPMFPWRHVFNIYFFAQFTHSSCCTKSINYIVEFLYIWLHKIKPDWSWGIWSHWGLLRVLGSYHWFKYFLKIILFRNKTSCSKTEGFVRTKTRLLKRSPLKNISLLNKICPFPFHLDPMHSRHVSRKWRNAA
jgi:hypothetical protein